MKILKVVPTAETENCASAARANIGFLAASHKCGVETGDRNS